jgi:hypothetical protein
VVSQLKGVVPSVTAVALHTPVLAVAKVQTGHAAGPGEQTRVEQSAAEQSQNPLKQSPLPLQTWPGGSCAEQVVPSTQ